MRAFRAGEAIALPLPNGFTLFGRHSEDKETNEKKGKMQKQYGKQREEHVYTHVPTRDAGPSNRAAINLDKTRMRPLHTRSQGHEGRL